MRTQENVTREVTSKIENPGTRAHFARDLTGGYGQERLEEVFDLVKNPVHWKDPIDARIDLYTWLDKSLTQDLVKYAVEFFTATEATISVSDDGRDFAITAKGYRAGPAGDH